MALNRLSYILLVISFCVISKQHLNAQAVIWTTHLEDKVVTSHQKLADTFFLAGTFDSCSRRYPVLMTVDATNGFVLSSHRYGFPVCVNQGTGDAWFLECFNDTVYYSLTAPDSTFPNLDLAVFGNSSQPFDTISNCDLPFFNLTPSQTHSKIINEGFEVRSINSNGSTIDSLYVPGTNWMTVVSYKSHSNIYAFNSWNLAFGADRLVGAVVDSAFNIVASDTIDPRNGPERIIDAKIFPQNSACIIASTNTVNFDGKLHRFDFSGDFTHHKAFGNNIITDVLYSDDSLYLFVQVAFMQSGFACIYKISPLDLTVIDSVVITANVNYNMALAVGGDGYIYAVNKAFLNTFRITKLDNNLNSLGFVNCPDTLGIYNQSLQVTAAPGGLVWVSAQSSVNNRSIFFHVNTLNVGNAEMHNFCDIGNSVLQAEFWNNLPSNCYPIEISVFNMNGQKLYEVYNPTGWNYTPEHTGLYLILLRFDDNRVIAQRSMMIARN